MGQGPQFSFRGIHAFDTHLYAVTSRHLADKSAERFAAVYVRGFPNSKTRTRVETETRLTGGGQRLLRQTGERKMARKILNIETNAPRA